MGLECSKSGILTAGCGPEQPSRDRIEREFGRPVARGAKRRWFDAGLGFELRIERAATEGKAATLDAVGKYVDQLMTAL